MSHAVTLTACVGLAFNPDKSKPSARLSLSAHAVRQGVKIGLRWHDEPPLSILNTAVCDARGADNEAE
ncbi:hypothetical protein [Acidihalobacter ferrooxydans]|uniref:hypothetical protein n=1 Tax=Acidihalobacter ferrooxydans TaxID=1765967 RepID=UPI0012ECB2F4|nr:hypothetical protein [Acidihalobacter ferrooxydans]